MKTLKKLLTLAALVLFAMTLTSCKAKIGGGEFSIFWQILAIFMWLAEISQSEYLLPKKIKFFRGLINFILIILFIAGITLPFIWCPIPYIPKISLGIAAFLWLIGWRKGEGVKAQQQAEAKAAAEAREKEEAKAQQEKAKELYESTMPIVKKYLEKTGFELPANENIFFMQIDENTGKWKYGTTLEINYSGCIENDDYDINYKSLVYCAKKYAINTKLKTERPCADGILLTSDGKAYIGTPQSNEKFWWHDEDGNGIDNSFDAPIHTVLAVGNITNQLLCGIHIKGADEKKGIKDENGSYASYTDNPNSVESDLYYCAHFPKSVKQIFILPSDDFEKKNTIVIGSSFTKCSNLRLFYCGFDKVAHEKFFLENCYYGLFEKNTHGTFICPSADCDILDEKYLIGRETNFAERNWELKVGTTIQNAVSLKDAKEASKKAEAEAKSKAESAEKANTLAETKAVLEQLENDLAAKKAEVASLGLDAQGIVQKAKLNKEIKDLEPQIETLKAEVERLSK